jgi:hypothetical protein
MAGRELKKQLGSHGFQWQQMGVETDKLLLISTTREYLLCPPIKRIIISLSISLFSSTMHVQEETLLLPNRQFQNRSCRKKMKKKFFNQTHPYIKSL